MARHDRCSRGPMERVAEGIALMDRAADPVRFGPARAGGRSDSQSAREKSMSDPVYVSRVTIQRVGGPTRRAVLPAEKDPILLGVHGAVAEHYGTDMATVDPCHHHRLCGCRRGRVTDRDVRRRAGSARDRLGPRGPRGRRGG
jgi:hypothetical protein